MLYLVQEMPIIFVAHVSIAASRYVSALTTLLSSLLETHKKARDDYIDHKILWLVLWWQVKAYVVYACHWWTQCPRRCLGPQVYPSPGGKRKCLLVFCHDVPKWHRKHLRNAGWRDDDPLGAAWSHLTTCTVLVARSKRYRSCDWGSTAYSTIWETRD